MKLVKAENGKKVIKMSKNEWAEIGAKNGWMVTAQSSSSHELFSGLIRLLKRYRRGEVDVNALFELGFSDPHPVELRLESFKSQVESLKKTFSNQLEDSLAVLDKETAKELFLLLNRK